MTKPTAWSTTRKFMGGSALAVIIGAFLPWFSVFGFSVSGIHGDGRLTLILAAIAIAVLYFVWAGDHRRQGIVQAVLQV
jgi:hypothetical protein